MKDLALNLDVADSWTGPPSVAVSPTRDERLRRSVSDLTDARHLKAVIERRLVMLAPVGTQAPRLSSAMRYALLAPGKRFRPILAIMASVQCGARDLTALDAACAIEMVHAASLILDDLPCMDDADLRRGQPTTHRHYGEDIAILAAIGLLNRAYGILASVDGLKPSQRTELIAALSEAIGPTGLIGGQEADLRDRDLLRQSNEIDRLYHAKTGILIEKAIEVGAVLGGASSRERAALKQFAHHLGLAFQTLDDLIDATASAEQACKDVRKDGGKPTMVDLMGIEGARGKIDHWLEEACQCLDQLRCGREPLAGFVKTTLAATIAS